MLRGRITFRGRAAYVLTVAFVLACIAIPAAGQKKQKTQKTPKYLLPEGTIIRLRTNDKLSSKDAQTGSRFTSTVVTPVYAKGFEVIPAGSIVAGHVTHVERASRKSQAGSLNVTFTSLELPNGAHHSISGSLAASDSADNEGQVNGKSSKERNAKFIGRGVVVGGLMNGAAGVVTGGLVGAARGLIKKGEEAEVSPGTEFNVVLNHGVSLTAYR
jgi:hypothetical protein